VKRYIKVKHVHFIVSNKLVLDRAPYLARGDAVLLDDVMKLIGDRAEDLRQYDALHALTSRVIDGRGIREDMVSEVVAL
jgi:hypothetical protein